MAFSPPCIPSTSNQTCVVCDARCYADATVRRPHVLNTSPDVRDLLLTHSVASGENVPDSRPNMCTECVHHVESTDRAFLMARECFEMLRYRRENGSRNTLGEKQVPDNENTSSDLGAPIESRLDESEKILYFPR